MELALAYWFISNANYITIDHSSWPCINRRRSLAQTFRYQKIEL